MTLAELQALDAGEGEKIPTLNEVFERFGKKLLINIELKNMRGFSSLLPDKVAALIQAYGLVDFVLISSFNPFYLQRFRRLCPEASLGILTLPKMANLWFWRFFQHDALHPYYKDVNQILVDKTHRYNRQVNTWTVDNAGEIQRLAGLQVDGIITNDPLQTRQILESAL
jgi:glycerophosphoryl diester phosphodiesterase